MDTQCQYFGIVILVLRLYQHYLNTINLTQSKSLTSVRLSTKRPSASTWDTYYYEKNLQGEINDSFYLALSFDNDICFR